LRHKDPQKNQSRKADEMRIRGIAICASYLAGVLHGDGWCTRLTIGLKAKDKDFVDTFCEAFNSVFSNKIKPRLDESGYWLARTSNKTGKFNGLRGYKPKNNVERATWLRGLFDSDGNAQLIHQPQLSPNAYGRRVAIYSTNKPTLLRASNYMRSLKIEHNIRRTKNSRSHIGSKTVFELRIIRKQGFVRFLRFVGSSIGRKQKRLHAIVSTYRNKKESCSLGGQRGSATRRARREKGGSY
jgi:hypothetical protein